MPRPSANTSELEAEIDQLCYTLYELTDEEIAVEGGRGLDSGELVENRKQRARSAG